MKRVREGYKITELGEIPEEWRLETMKNIIVSTQLGTNTLGKEGVINGIPMLKMGNLTIGGFNFDKVEYIESEELEDNKEYILNNGDFLFNTRNTLELVGKSATWNNQLPVAIFNSNIMRIKYKSNIDDFYMSYYFEDSAGWKHLKAIATGTTSVAAVYTKDLMKVKVKLPTLKEQQKISLVLSSVDEQIEITDNLIEKTKYLKKGLMQKLFTKGIGHSRFKDTEIGKIPEEWEVVKFKDITDILRCGVASTPTYVEEGVPFLSAQNVQDGKLSLHKYNYISEEYHKELTKNDKPQRGDILYSRVGANYGIATVVNIDFEFSVYVSLTLIRLKNGFNSNFYKYLLNSPMCRKQADIGVFQGAGVPNLNVKIVEKFNMLVPPLKEQQEIAFILLSVDEQIEHYEVRKEKLQELKKGLMQKLLTGSIRVKV